MTISIGFIGAGNMGRPFVRALLQRGFAVTVHDHDPACESWVRSHGAKWAHSPALTATNCKILITCLPLPSHVREMMIDHGALAALPAGAVWIDTSTTDYHNTLDIARIATHRGVMSLEAPVSNLSHMGVDFNNVCFYVGGSTAAYHIARPVLDAMGQYNFHVGAIGQGQSVKLLTNLLFYCAALAWGELLLVAQSHGLDLRWFWSVAKESRANCFVVDQVTPMLLDGSYDHSCTLEITVKDMALTIALADELGVAMPLGRRVEARYRQAGDCYPARANHLKVVELMETENDRRLLIDDFTAPSPYGADRTYRHPGTYVTDSRGRLKPSLPERYQYELSHPACGGYADCLLEVMAQTNHTILEEALQLGRAMGLAPSLLQQVVSRSCGASWVDDHLDGFTPNQALMRDFPGLMASLHLPILHNLQLDAAGVAHAARFAP
jgi:3-hydroxyisobutyrate dehydrogenase-like beta-hydroxyacid dehydrogenase